MQHWYDLEADRTASFSVFQYGGAATGVPSIPEQALASAVQSLCSIAADTKSSHAATAALALGHAGLQSALPLLIDHDGRAISVPVTGFHGFLSQAVMHLMVLCMLFCDRRDTESP